MAATKSDIREWLKEAQRLGATHMVVMTDLVDFDDSPLYIMPGKDPREEFELYKLKMGDYKVMECYAMHLDIESQLNEWRAQHWGPAPAGKTL